MVAEVENVSYGRRIGNSLAGVIFGPILILAAIALLWWNEGNAVKVRKTLERGASGVISVPSDTVNRANEGKLVHTTGTATTQETIKDEIFGVEGNALKLERIVEMYQWKEDSKTRTEKKLGGGERRVTEYTYDKTWSEAPIDSSRFKERAGHENPGHMAYRSQSFTARNVSLGAFTLSGAIVSRIENDQTLTIDASAVPDALKAKHGDRLKIQHSQLYLGPDPASPAIGDLRIRFKRLPATTISLVYKQAGDGFEAYHVKDFDRSIGLIEKGQVGPDRMFQQAQAENRMRTWILRLVGFLAMAVGFMLITAPLGVIAGFIPFVGNLVGTVTALFAFLLSAALSGAIIAVAWIIYRPVLGLVILAGITIPAVAALVLTGRKKGRTIPVKRPTASTPRRARQEPASPRPVERPVRQNDADDGFDI